MGYNNDYYFILTGMDFCVKENKIDRLLLHGLVEDGIYPINENKNFINKLCCLTSKLGTKATSDQWHDRLGHLASHILEYLSAFLQIKKAAPKFSICCPCQLGKAKKLPFPDSTKQSTRPLALIHTNV